MHKARELSKEDFQQAVERELTGKITEPWEIVYFKLYQSQIPVIDRALETAALMLGSDRSRGYCLEMICADFLAGANLDNGDPETLLFAIVVDESLTSGRGMMASTKGAPPHDWLGNTGGAIGIAMPLVVGAALACPDRRVLCLTADGSGMYTLQALSTMAREGLNVATVVFAKNRDYAVLKREFSYLGAGSPGPRALSVFEIGRPDLDWVHLAKGMGVPGVRVRTLGEFAKHCGRGSRAKDRS